jgi:hypothetical protein
LAVEFLRLCSQAGEGKDLTILHYSLLELAKQDPES